MMFDKTKGNELLDYYGCLLTNHQLSVLKDYFQDDLSMNEISENLSISKAAVSDLINRSIKQLLLYEEKLHLIAQNEKLDKIIDELDKKDAYCQKIAKKLTNIYRRLEKCQK